MLVVCSSSAFSLVLNLTEALVKRMILLVYTAYDETHQWSIRSDHTSTCHIIQQHTMTVGPNFPWMLWDTSSSSTLFLYGDWRSLHIGMKWDPQIHAFGLLKHYILRQHVSMARKLKWNSTLSYYHPHRLWKRLYKESLSQMGFWERHCSKLERLGKDVSVCACPHKKGENMLFNRLRLRVWAIWRSKMKTDKKWGEMEKSSPRLSIFSVTREGLSQCILQSPSCHSLNLTGPRSIAFCIALLFIKLCSLCHFLQWD